MTFWIFAKHKSLFFIFQNDSHQTMAGTSLFAALAAAKMEAGSAKRSLQG